MQALLDKSNYIVKYLVMEKVNVFELKARLSEFLARIEQGERILICRRNRPIAEIRAVDVRQEPRPFGGAKGQFTVPASFFTPLPAGVLDDFEGRAVAFVPPQSRVAAVAREDASPLSPLPRHREVKSRAPRQPTKTNTPRKRSR